MLVVPAVPALVHVVIDTDRRTLSLYRLHTLVARFPCAVGKPTTPTPLGHWYIVRKARWSGGFGTRWMQLSVPWGIYGIHGTNKPGSIGTRASGGCVRMFNRDVERLFDLVGVGTPVTVVGSLGQRSLYQGDRGSDVVAVQRALRDLHYYRGPESGIFDEALTRAVVMFQKRNQIVPDGNVGLRTYRLLGLAPKDQEVYPVPAPMDPGESRNSG